MVTRRNFLQGAVAGVVACLAAAGGALGLARRGRARKAKVTLPVPEVDGFTFHDEVVLVKSGSELTALSSRCSHLGCRIDRAADQQLVCPCHGSRFDLRGKRIAGPATADLEPLRFSGGDGGAVVDVELS